MSEKIGVRATFVMISKLNGDFNFNPRFRFVLASAVAVVIFRGELALLLGTAAAADLFVGRKIRLEITIFIF